jgi:predicted phosphohydrolase
MNVFGRTWEKHEERIKENWINTVKDGDTVVIAGDVSWGMTFDEAKEDLLFLNSLPGKKIILKGNHDYWWATQAKVTAFFEKNGFHTIRMLHNNAFAVENFLIAGSRGWYNDENGNNVPSGTDYRKIVAREAIRVRLSLTEAQKLDEQEGLNREKLVFLHFPPVFREFRCEEILAVLREFGVTRCFYGHIHGVYDMPGSFVDDGIKFTLVSADYLGFTPLHIPKVP